MSQDPVFVTCKFPSDELHQRSVRYRFNAPDGLPHSGKGLLTVVEMEGGRMHLRLTADEIHEEMKFYNYRWSLSQEMADRLERDPTNLASFILL